MQQDIISLLDEKVELYNQPAFIESDPISIPHRFSQAKDREISGFLTATIAWGQRKTIINNASHLMQLMEYSPYEFIRDFSEKDLVSFQKFVHRTFNYTDLITFLYALKNIYQVHGGMENVFFNGLQQGGMAQAIGHFRDVFFEIPHASRTCKHVSNPAGGASAKRINMFLRWMVRKDNKGVDFGIWNKISQSQLFCPLDLHSGKVSRKLGLLSRKQDDWKAVNELTNNLRLLDPADPVKYDFALFGLGVFEGY